MVFHIHPLRVDPTRDRPSPWHQLTPQTRLFCSLLLVFAVSLTPNGQWLTWCVYAVVVGAIACLSQVPPVKLIQRIAVEFLFVGLVLLGTVFRSSGTVVWEWGILRITLDGLTVLASVSIKMLLSLTMLNILILTTPIPNLLQALLVLRVPRLLVAILAAMHRYIDVLVDEVHCLRRAAQARNLLANPHWQRVVLGNIIGLLFIRTLDRGEQIHQAMLARGYSGLPPVTELPRNQFRDRITWVLILGLGIAGQLLPLLRAD